MVDVVVVVVEAVMVVVVVSDVVVNHVSCYVFFSDSKELIGVEWSVKGNGPNCHELWKTFCWGALVDYYRTGRL